MTTILNTDGKVGIPEQIREADRLAAGDSFEVERLGSGQYLLTKRPANQSRFTLATGDDGLPVIRAEGVITTKLVKQIENELL